RLECEAHRRTLTGLHAELLSQVLVASELRLNLVVARPQRDSAGRGDARAISNPQRCAFRIRADFDRHFCRSFWSGPPRHEYDSCNTSGRDEHASDDLRAARLLG